jgi:hypothetical protein
MAIAGTITTGSHPKALWPGVHAFWGQIFNEHPPEYPDLFDIETSDMAYEEDVQITGFGLAQVKGEGAPITYDSETQGPVTRYVHVAYALGYQVTYEEQRDNLYEKISMRRAKANAFSMVQTIENLTAGFYNRGFNPAYTLADGQPLLSTAHPFTTGGSFSNVLTPAADLSEAALEDICIQIMGYQTDRGLLVNFMPTSLHVPRQEWYNAQRILKSILQSDTSNNAINALQATNAFPKGIKLNHYFTAPHAWFVRTNAMNGLQFFWREKPVFDKDNDFDTKNAKAASYMRLSFGCTDPRAIAGSNGP